MAGLLDSFPPGLDQATMDALRAYVSQYAPSEDDKKQALKQGLLAAGFGMMGARKGDELGAIGRAGLGGMGAYNNELTRVNQQKMGSVASATQAMNLQEKLRQFQSDDLGRKIATDYAAQNGAPGQSQFPQAMLTPQAPQAPMGPPTASGDMSAQMPQAPQSLQGAGTPAGVPGKNLTYAYYAGLAQKYYAAGLTDKAAQAEATAEKYRPKLKDTKTLTQNGQRVTVNFYEDGTQEVVPFGPDKEKAVQVDTGGKTVFADPYTGNVVPGGAVYDKTQTPDSKASNALGYANLKETTRYHNLELGMDENGSGTGNIDAVAKAIASYQQPGLSSFAMGKPMGASIMGKVMEINPTYDAKNYQAAQKTLSNFSTGKEAATVRAFNVGLQHLDTLGKAADALGNNDIQLFNKVGNFFAQQTGSAAPTNFDATKQIVGNEIVKAIVGAGGGVGDREKAQDTVSKANSPQQLAGVINQYKQLMGGQLGGLRQSYQQGTGRDDFDRLLSPEALAVTKGGGSGPGPAQPAGTDKQTGKPLYRRADGKLYFSPQ